MASIHPRTTQPSRLNPRGVRYDVRWRDAGGKERSRTFPRKDLATKYRAEIEDSLAKGTYVDPQAGKVKMRDHARHWLATHPMSPGYQAKVRSIVNNHIVPTFGDVALSEMSPTGVRDFLAALSRPPMSLRPSTVRTISEVLSSLNHYAVDGGLLRSGFMPRRLALPPDNADERIFLTRAQFGDLLAKVDEFYRPLVFTAAWTGLRWGELVGLRRRDVDLKARRLTVRNSLNYSSGAPTFGPLKTKASRRTVLITKSNAGMLKEHLDEHGYGPQGTVFSTLAGALLRDDNFRPRIWKPAVRKARSVPDQTRFHDLRHTHVALCIEAGMDLKQIQARLGHSSIKITGDRYAHLYEGVTRRAVDALERLPKGN